MKMDFGLLLEVTEDSLSIKNFFSSENSDLKWKNGTFGVKKWGAHLDSSL